MGFFGLDVAVSGIDMVVWIVYGVQSTDNAQDLRGQPTDFLRID
jgi:hypothetical protein